MFSGPYTVAQLCCEWATTDVAGDYYYDNVVANADRNDAAASPVLVDK